MPAENGSNQYLHDSEGRICAVDSSMRGRMTGYLYVTDANRVAKGTIQT